MAKPFPLRPLLHLAQQKNEAARKRLGLLNQNRQLAETKLETLQQYRRDYQAMFQQAVANGIAPEDMRNFQDFIYRLDAAIAQQQSLAEQAQQSVQRGQQDLLETQRKMKSLDALEQRHLEAERKTEAKKEQRAQDEYAGRFAARHAAEKNGNH